jgi:hypothetical protein
MRKFYAFTHGKCPFFQEKQSNLLYTSSHFIDGLGKMFVKFQTT